MSFKEINISELSFNPFDKIGKEWFLVTAGNRDGYNTMTASWGFMGVMWGKNVMETVIRPTRHTFGYMESSELFTVSFFDEKYREALKFCGSHSGRDCDKAKEAGITPLFTEGTAAFEEANMIFICKKLYSQTLDLSALAEGEQHWYNGDPHKAFIGEIVKVLVRE
ncbi:MAG: flavin reductase [Oscillospiraceae bacterium]|nr:flavin reductase [Oscillospiraceae bacterium]